MVYTFFDFFFLCMLVNARAYLRFFYQIKGTEERICWIHRVLPIVAKWIEALSNNNCLKRYFKSKHGTALETWKAIYFSFVSVWNFQGIEIVVSSRFGLTDETCDCSIQNVIAMEGMNALFLIHWKRFFSSHTVFTVVVNDGKRWRWSDMISNCSALKLQSAGHSIRWMRHRFDPNIFSLFFKKSHTIFDISCLKCEQNTVRRYLQKRKDIDHLGWLGWNWNRWRCLCELYFWILILSNLWSVYFYRKQYHHRRKNTIKSPIKIVKNKNFCNKVSIAGRFSSILTGKRIDQTKD